VTEFAGEDRYEWIEKEVQKYRTRRRRAAGLYLLGALEAWILIPILVILPFDIRAPYAITVLAIFLATVYGAGWFKERSEKLLPPVEDRVLFRLKPAITSLKVFVRDWSKSERKTALKNLRRVANILDLWNMGNLKFVKKEIEDVLTEFKKNFRGRVLLAVEKTDKQNLKEVLRWLTTFQSALDTETMNKESLQAWNERLWNFPYEEPSKDILKRLASQWLQVVVVLSIPFVPIASGLVSFYVVHTTADNAAIVAATVFTGMVAMAALAYLIFSRQKGTWRV
jgi:hypothetical protein